MSQPSPKVTLESGWAQGRARSLLDLWRGDPGVERDALLLSCWILLEIFCLVSIASTLLVCLSSAAWFTSGEAGIQHSLPFWLQHSVGLANAAGVDWGWGSTWKTQLGHTYPGSSRQCNILAHTQPAKAVMLILCSLERLFFWPFFSFISGSEFIKRLTTQGALQLHHLHRHTASRSPPASDQLKRKKKTQKHIGKNWKQNWMKNVFLKRPRISRI